MTKPWEEEWMCSMFASDETDTRTGETRAVSRQTIVANGHTGVSVLWADGVNETAELAAYRYAAGRLAAAAPAMVRELCMVEWRDGCPCCGSMRGLVYEERYSTHAADCTIDAALTAAGLDAAAREAVRQAAR